MFCKIFYGEFLLSFIPIHAIPECNTKTSEENMGIKVDVPDAKFKNAKN